MPCCDNNIFKRIKDKINYFGDHSNLHGIGNVLSLSYIPTLKRLFWFAILVACGVGAGAILRASLLVFSDSPVTYSVETNYLDWETPFPAVTVCQQVDMEQVKTYLAKNNHSAKLTTFYMDVSSWNLRYCKLCTNCDLNVTCEDDYVRHVTKIRGSCSDVLKDCWWGDEHFPCCDRFLPVNTEYGGCFAFNSKLSGNDSIQTVSRKTGLPTLVMTSSKAVSLRIHSPDDVVTVPMENILSRHTSIPLVTDYEILFKIELITSDSAATSLSQDTRGCLMSHEQPLAVKDWPFRLYTYTSCLMYYRAVSQIHFCNCTHHFMPTIGKYRTCDVNGLACLSKNKDALQKISYPCPMSCDDLTVKLVHEFFHRHTGEIPPELVARGTRIKIQLIQLPDLRVLRRAFKDTLAFVVDIGGVVGVFFGASLLSFLEIVYLLCIRKRS